MEQKYKYNYLAFLVDEKITKSYFVERDKDNLPFEKEYKHKHYTNHRRKFFCSCGNSFEVHATALERDNYIFCKNCKTKKSEKEIIFMDSRLAENVTKLKYKVFIDDDLVKLVKFTQRVGLNIKSKKLFFKNSREQIIFNKKTKRFFYYNSDPRQKKKIISIGLKRIEEVMRNFLYNSHPYSRSCTSPGLSRVPYRIRKTKEDLFIPINEFLGELEKSIEEKDRNRVSSYLQKITMSDLIENKNSYNKDFHSKFYNNVCILMPILQYKYFATLLFDKGNYFFIKSIKNSPSVSYIKRLKPTSPKNIIKSMTIQKVEESKYCDRLYIKDLKESIKLSNISNEIKSIKYKIKEVEKTIKDKSKIKRKLNKLNIPNFLYKDLDYDNFWIVEKFYELLGSIEYNFFISSIQKYGTFDTLKAFSQITSFLDRGQHDFLKEIKSNKNLYEKLFTQALVLSKKEPKYSHAIYCDTLNFALQRNYGYEEFLKLKSWDRIEGLHDELYQIIQLEKIEKFNKGIQEFAKKYKKIKDVTINGVQFKLIDSTLMLEKESKIMRHCVKTYAQRLSEGRHLIFSVLDIKTGDRATLEFYNKSPKGDRLPDFWVFNQLKSKFNRKSTEKIINATIDFCDEVLKKEKIKFSINQEYHHDLKIESKENKAHRLALPIREEIEVENLGALRRRHMQANQQVNNLAWLDDEDLPF